MRENTHRRILGSLGRTMAIALCCVVVSLSSAQVVQALSEEASFEVSGRYTAQRKPRVTVLEFEDTNAAAQNASYGASVQAMLVTFLKRKSQMVVVERQKLGKVLDEWRRNQEGWTNVDSGFHEDRQLLESIDAIILGNVTLLGMTETETARPTQAGDAKAGARRAGEKVEIDAKLLSRADGRIIAAAQRSGPVSCLRSIVERLGIALEQELLRPYYGKLKIHLSEPENVRVFLTPILLDIALDEEKPPVERGATVIMGSERDIVEPWTTDPTTYTIENILSGWYSMRLERPGYVGLGTENARWEAQERFGRVRVVDRLTKRSLEYTDRELRRFIVHVDPLETELMDGDSLDFTFAKKGGSLAARVKRQYLDEGYSQVPRRVILIGDEKLEINHLEPPDEYADDESCDLFEERLPNRVDYGRTYVAAGQPFDFETFKGGELIIEEYREGDVLPVGRYEMTLWEPYYELQTATVTVQDRDTAKPVRSALVRSTDSLDLGSMGARSPHKLILQGSFTSQRIEVPLDFTSHNTQTGLPVDSYMATTDIPGLDAWQRVADLLPESISPPIYDPESEESPPLKRTAATDAEAARPTTLRIKTRLCFGGRTSVLSSLPKASSREYYLDERLRLLLDALLDRDEIPEEIEGGRGSDLGRAMAGMALDSLLESPVPEMRQAGQLILAGQLAQAGLQPTSASPSASAPAGPPEPPAESAERPEPLPREPGELRALLAEHLRDTDLLLLDDVDMARLRERPQVAEIVREYVDSGGTLFAFVNRGGGYEVVVGAPLTLDDKGKETKRFELIAGEVSGIRFQFSKKKVKVKVKRSLLKIERFRRDGGDWRVVAFGRGIRDPRVIERGGRGAGGYVAIWADNPSSFSGRRGGTVEDVESARAEVEDRVWKWARYLMYTRYDATGVERAHAQQTLTR